MSLGRNSRRQTQETPEQLRWSRLVGQNEAMAIAVQAGVGTPTLPVTYVSQFVRVMSAMSFWGAVYALGEP